MLQSSIGPQATASEIVAGHDLRGKTLLITGASAGIGYEAARTLLSAHAEVIIAGRSRTNGEQAVQTLRAAYPDEQVHFLLLDLGSLVSVRQAAAQFSAQWNRLDVLINNAAVMATPLGYTSEGFEQQFGINFLGHFLLTRLLLPVLSKAAPARVVSLTSSAHRASDIHFEDIHFEQRPYEKWAAYGQSKTADALLGVALTRHAGEMGITANAVNPGGARTGLQQHLSAEEMRARGYYDQEGNLSALFQTTEQAASTTVWASIGDELAGVGGLYLERCQQAPPRTEDMLPGQGYMPYALNPEHAEQIWVLAEKLVGL
ncbi:MAG TPA: SDR family NAD(P)-dependent oxidoreductase [Ktedonobacteraceae bacterium]